MIIKSVIKVFQGNFKKMFKVFQASFMLRQTLYKVQVMLIPVLNILSFQIKERVAFDTIIFDPNLYVILLSFAKLE